MKFKLEIELGNDASPPTGVPSVPCQEAPPWPIDHALLGVNDMSRPNWHRYFLDIAKAVSTRATCNRAHVGAVIVKDKTILSTGYNGSPSGCPHCDDDGHMMRTIGDKQSCVATVHAEANAIAQAAKKGIATEMSTIYCTHNPCFECTKLLINAGIREIIYENYYESRLTKEASELAHRAGVGLIHYVDG